MSHLFRATTIASIIVLTGYQPTMAQFSLFPNFNEQVPATVQRLIQGPLPPPTTSSDQPSQVGITLPSLWWVDRQFGEKLVIDWFAYDSDTPQNQQVQLFIRSNLWTRFTYLERYAFVTHFGAIARTYGYQTLLLDRRGYPLASYLCAFETQQPQSISGVQNAKNQLIQIYGSSDQGNLPCSIWMNSAFPRNSL